MRREREIRVERYWQSLAVGSELTVGALSSPALQVFLLVQPIRSHPALTQLCSPALLQVDTVDLQLAAMNNARQERKARSVSRPAPSVMFAWRLEQRQDRPSVLRASAETLRRWLSSECAAAFSASHRAVMTWPRRKRPSTRSAGNPIRFSDQHAKPAVTRLEGEESNAVVEPGSHHCRALWTMQTQSGPIRA